MEYSLFKSKTKRDNTFQSLFNLVIKMLLDNVKKKFPQVLASFGGNLVFSSFRIYNLKHVRDKQPLN